MRPPLSVSSELERPLNALGITLDQLGLGRAAIARGRSRDSMGGLLPPWREGFYALPVERRSSPKPHIRSRCRSCHFGPEPVHDHVAASISNPVGCPQSASIRWLPWPPFLAARLGAWRSRPWRVARRGDHHVVGDGRFAFDRIETTSCAWSSSSECRTSSCSDPVWGTAVAGMSDRETMVERPECSGRAGATCIAMGHAPEGNGRGVLHKCATRHASRPRAGS